jgi:hypothetical protein
MVVGFAFMEKEECGCLVSLNLEDELARVLFWFLFFMISRGIKVLIGGLDCGRMRSCYYLEASGSAQ